MINITPDFLAPYFRGEKKHKAYADTVEAYMDLKVHVDGEYPSQIINERRPSEPQHIKEYRQKIFAAVTMPTCSKVLNCLGKIRKSHDWLIKYDQRAVPASINEAETLEAYMEKNFPVYGSATKWAFDVLIKQLETDAHAVCLVMPDMTKQVAANEYTKPFPVIFNSDKVYEFIEGEVAVLLSSDTVEYKVGDVTVSDGKVFYVATPVEIQRWEQTAAFDYTLRASIKHGSDKMPAWRLGGLFWKSYDRTPLFRPRIYPMVPFLKEAVREYTDLQAGVVQHLYLERWEYEGADCPSCKGIGTKLNKAGEKVRCTAKGCDGGKVMSSPYQVIRMKRPTATDPVNFTPPPAGYIDRNVEIIKVQDERIEKHGYKALAAVNMEFLAQTPLNTSGEAKKTDMEETNNFVYGVGEDIVGNLDKVYYFVNDQRYSVLIKDAKTRRAMLPTINVPEKLNVFTSEYLVAEMGAAKTAGVNPVLVCAMEKEYAGKKFNADPSVKMEVELVLNLDPMPGITEDQKMSRLQNKGVTELDYVISSNISLFVREALFEDPDFATLPYDKQMEVMVQKAEAKMQQNSASAQVMNQLGDGQDGTDGDADDNGDDQNGGG